MDITSTIKNGESQTVEFKLSFQKESVQSWINQIKLSTSTRNKLLALMFKECGLIEKYGSGIGRIKKFCKEHKIKEPKFEELQKGFQVTLYKEVLTPQKSTKVKILELMRDDKDITITSISAELNIGRDTINEHISTLKKEEKLKRIGGRKDGYWEVDDAR